MEFNLTLPTYEQIKEAFIEEIKENGIGISEEYLIEEIFNPDSELYQVCRLTTDAWLDERTGNPDFDPNDMSNYKVESAWGNSPSQILYEEMELSNLNTESIVIDLIVQLNRDNGYFEDDGDFNEYLINGDGYDTMKELQEDFDSRFENETSIEELKDIILSIKRGER